MREAELGAGLEAAGWFVVVEGDGRVVAQRRMLGTPHDWMVMFLHQLGAPWVARLYRRERRPSGAYEFVPLGDTPAVHTVGEAIQWLGGMGI